MARHDGGEYNDDDGEEEEEGRGDMVEEDEQ